MYLRFPSLINDTGASASYDSNAQAYFNKELQTIHKNLHGTPLF